MPARDPEQDRKLPRRRYSKFRNPASRKPENKAVRPLIKFTNHQQYHHVNWRIPNRTLKHHGHVHAKSTPRHIEYIS
jgi:hypothetical protein